MPRTSDTIQNFKNHVIAWHGSTISVVCAGAAAILRDRLRAAPEDTIKRLQSAVVETGKKTAMVYRYVGLAKALAARIEKQAAGAPSNEPGGVTLDRVVSAENAQAATEELVTFLDEQGVASVDAISVLLDTYKRSPKKRTAARRAGAPAIAERVSTATIRDVVAKAPDEKIVAAFVRAPNKDFVHLATEMAKQIDDRDALADVIQVFEDRMEELVKESGRRRPRRAEDARHLQ